MTRRADAAAVGDPHRDGLYAAEGAALPDGGRRFARFVELEAFVAQVVTGAWWEQTFPDAPIEVDVERRSRSATFSAAHVTPDAMAGVIWVRDGSWDLVTVVHELAHVALAGVEPSDGPHGAAFARTLLVCWRELCGVSAYGALRSEMAARGIPLHRDHQL